MNQFDHFSVTRDLDLVNDDMQGPPSSDVSPSPHSQCGSFVDSLEAVELSTEMKSLQDTYSFYTMNSLNKQVFHVNELLCSSGGGNACAL